MLRTFRFKILGIIIVGALLTTVGCNSVPGENLGKNALQQKLDKYLPQRFLVKSFLKTNAISSEVNGVKIYSMEYKAEIKALKSSPKRSSFVQIQGIENIYGRKFLKDIYFLEKDKSAFMEGTIKFFMTENGWEHR